MYFAFQYLYFILPLLLLNYTLLFAKHYQDCILYNIIILCAFYLWWEKSFLCLTKPIYVYSLSPCAFLTKLKLFYTVGSWFLKLSFVLKKKSAFLLNIMYLSSYSFLINIVPNLATMRKISI